MSALEKQASANIVSLLQGKPAASRGVAKPAAPRVLSRADALSLRVHASSALVPNAAVISPVVRIHLVDPELGSPVRPSGEATTPIQTAPFDLTRRRAATFAAEWEEALEVEEALGDVLTARAVALFEVLQLPPSFTYYEERSASFPDGRPMRVAWGFLKLLRGSDGKPNMGRLKVQLYRWDDRAGALGSRRRRRRRPRRARGVHGGKRALQVVPSMRRLYPAHLDVTVAASPRSDVVAALLGPPAGAGAPPLATRRPRGAEVASGAGDDDDAPRPDAPRAYRPRARDGRRLAQRRDAPGARARLRAGGGGGEAGASPARDAVLRRESERRRRRGTRRSPPRRRRRPPVCPGPPPGRGWPRNAPW